MNHDTLKERIFALYDGELDANARKEAEVHLAACVECREIYAGWSKTSAALFRAPKAEPSEFFVRQVMARVHELKKPQRPAGWKVSLRWLVPAVGMAALFLMVMRPAPVYLSMDMMLTDSPDIHSFAFYGDAPTQDETLEFVMGGSI